MNRKKILLISIYILSALQFHVFAQISTGNIKGSVFTNDEKPAEGVRINLKKTGFSTITNASGQFSFKNISPGTYELSSASINLQTQFKTVSIKAGETISIQFILSESQAELQDVTVTGTKSFNDRSTSIGKIDIAQRDLPQSITVINRNILERQQAVTMADVLQNINGVYLMGTTGGTQEEIAGRGYAFSSSNTFKNGVRFNNGIRPEISSLEKIEMLKGGNALMFGNVSAGGILNLVTAKPKFQQGGSISFRGGSYDFYKPTIDVYGAINNSKHVAYRVNTTYEKAKSFRNGVSSERLYINPSLLYKTSDRTDILVETDYLKDTRTPDYGTGAINYRVADNGRNIFLNVPWAFNKTKQASLTSTATHTFNQSVQLRGIFAYQRYDNELFSANRPNAASQMVSANGTWIRSLTQSATNENYYYSGIDLNVKFKLGTQQHHVISGVDADNYKTITTTFANYTNSLIGKKNIYDTINIFNPTSTRSDIPFLAKDRITTTPIERIGIYIQDHISASSKLKLLLGGRYTLQHNLSATVDTLARNTRGFIKNYKSAAISPKAGVVFQPSKTTSVFVSYSNSFNVNTGIDIHNEPLRPSIIDQYEIGVKNDLFKNLLAVNISLYQINNSDLAQAVTVPPATAPNARELTGATVSRGIELDIVSRPIKGFHVLAGYSFNDMRYTESKEFTVGTRLRYNPAHTGNASVYYNFKDDSKLKGLNVGVGMFYTGDRLAGRSTTVVRPDYKLMALPDFTTFDFNLGYSLKNLSLRLKLSNVFNVLSYNAHDDNSVNPIAPRLFAATMSYKF